MILWATNVTYYNNYHTLITKLQDTSLLVKYMIDEFIFKEKLGHNNIQNNTTICAFYNLFYIGTCNLSNSKVLSRYVKFIYSNEENDNQDNEFISNITNNDYAKSKTRNFNRSGNNPKYSNGYAIYNWLLTISFLLIGRLLTILTISAGESFFFFFFLNGPSIKDNMALHFRFYFLAAFSIFFLPYCFNYCLYFWTLYLGHFLPKYLPFYNFFFSATCTLAISFLIIFAYFLACFTLGVSHNFLPLWSLFFTNIPLIFIQFSGIRSLVL